MANEITLNASVAYEDSEDTEESLEIAALLKSVATKKVIKIKQAIPTSEVAINLGGIAAPGYTIIVNRDLTNYVSFRRASGETEAFRLDPINGFLIGKLGSGSQVPYLIANTAACQVEFLICST